MFPAKFDYFRAGNLEEAARLLDLHEDAKVLAGGHSLLPMMKLRLAQPPAVIDIGRVAELRGITDHGDSMRIGALTTHGEIATSDALQQHCPLIAEAAGHIGDPQVRNKGTLGGNIAHADPASDLPAVLVATGASVHIAGSGGTRAVAAGDFFTGLLETALGENEILVAVDIPRASGPSGSAYLKHEHPASGYAICGAAALVVGVTVSLCFNGVSAVPYSATAVAEALSGSSLDDSAIDQAVDNHLAIDDPLGDIQASGSYRVELAKVFGKRALKLARDRARS